MKNKTNITIGKRIRKYRKDLELTQEGLAKKAGLTTNTIARLERGENYPCGPTAPPLAKALGLTLDELLKV